jgi:predicted permease
LTAELFSIIAPVYLCIAIGFVWRKSGRRVDSDLLADLCMNVGAPCLIFSSLVGLDVEITEVLDLVWIVLIAHVLFAIVAGAVLRVFDLPSHTFLAPMLFANTGNMGLPVAMFAFGPAGLVLGVTFFAMTSILHFTVGQWIWSGRMSMGPLLRTPLVYATLGAVIAIAADLPVPRWLLLTAENVGSFTIPLMQFTLGVSLAKLQVGRLPRSVGLSLLRIGMGVGVGVGLAHAFGLEGAARGVVILDCAMPVAVINYLFAERANRSPSEVASLVVISTGISFVTLPVILAFVI